MSWVERLTPKKTTEVKPGLFIQQIGETSFRQVYPASWDGKIIWKNFLFGGHPVKIFVTLVIIILLAYGYSSSTKACEEFQADPCPYLPKLVDYCIDYRDSGGIPSVSDLERSVYFSGEVGGLTK